MTCHEYEIPIFERMLADPETVILLGPYCERQYKDALEKAKRYREMRLERESL
jgi:hypothetical protein